MFMSPKIESKGEKEEISSNFDIVEYKNTISKTLIHFINFIVSSLHSPDIVADAAAAADNYQFDIEFVFT